MNKIYACIAVLFQVWVMATDIIIIALCSGSLYLVYGMGNIWLFDINLLLVPLIFGTWYGQGGFIAWKPSSIRAFFKNFS